MEDYPGPIPELEDLLRRMPYSFRVPPSALRQLFENYAQLARIADAAQRKKAQRTFLSNSHRVYARPEFELKPGEGLQVPVLMNTALKMALKPGSRVGSDASRRQKALDDLLQEYEQETTAPEDRDFYRRIALARFIKENAADPGLLEVEAPETTIENLDKNQLCCPRCGGEDVDNSERLSPQSGNSGDYVAFACRTCGYREEGMDGDIPARSSPWAKRRT